MGESLQNEGDQALSPEATQVPVENIRLPKRLDDIAGAVSDYIHDMQDGRRDRLNQVLYLDNMFGYERGKCQPSELDADEHFQDFLHRLAFVEDPNSDKSETVTYADGSVGNMKRRTWESKIKPGLKLVEDSGLASGVQLGLIYEPALKP